jgi:hypothetical protein
MLECIEEHVCGNDVEGFLDSFKDGCERVDAKAGEREDEFGEVSIRCQWCPWRVGVQLFPHEIAFEEDGSGRGVDVDACRVESAELA